MIIRTFERMGLVWKVRVPSPERLSEKQLTA
jgi:hypothetical protein